VALWQEGTKDEDRNKSSSMLSLMPSSSCTNTHETSMTKGPSILGVGIKH
jgi:hypothetical protein